MCECDKTCDIGKYLDYEKCKCRKKLVDKLMDECTDNIKEVKLAKITLEHKNENSYKCTSWKVYIVFVIIVFTIFTGITIYFVYYSWSLIQNMILALNLVLAKKQKFVKCNSIEWTYKLGE